MKKIKRVGVLGGLFDPPHIGHLIIAQSVLEEFYLNRVIFIPAGNPPHKLHYSSYALRYEMTRLAISGNKKFAISNIEKRMSGKTYTAKVIRELKMKVRSEIYLIIGSDQWLDIKIWKTPEKLFRECKIIVVPRSPYKIKKTSRFYKKILISQSPLIDVSSTMIRKKFKENYNVRYLVPPQVYTYIKQKKLYK